MDNSSEDKYDSEVRGIMDKYLPLFEEGVENNKDTERKVYEYMLGNKW